MQTLTESDGQLIQNWYIIALSRELKNLKPLKRQLYDKTYVLFRDQNGKASILLDRCAHRGTQLSLGRCHKGQIQCPYHGWIYNSNGLCTHIPSEGQETISNSDANRRSLSVYAPPVVEQDGCIWIWAGDMNKKTVSPPWRFPYFDKDGWCQYFMITDFENEVTNLVENFMDVPHTVFVHKNWFREKAHLKVPVQLQISDARVKVTYQQPSDNIGFFSRILNPHKKPMTHTDEFIFPNITRVDYGFGENAFIINSQCSPISRFQTRVYTWITYRIGWLSRPIKPVFKCYTRQVINQDVNIMKNQGDNLRRYGYGEFKSTQADELHLAIERLRRLGAQGDTNLGKQSYSRQREFWI